MGGRTLNHQSYHNKTHHSTCETSSTIEQSTKFLMNYLNYHKLRYKNVSTCCHSSIYFVNLVQAKGYCFRYKKIVSLNNLHSWIIRIKRNLRKEDNAQCIWLIDYPWISNMAIARFETLLKRAPRQWIVSENQPVINHFPAIKLNNITWALLLKI